MKSITIKDKSGKVLLKVIHRKNGVIDGIKDTSITGVSIEARDDKNCKIMLFEDKGVEI